MVFGGAEWHDIVGVAEIVFVVGGSLGQRRNGLAEGIRKSLVGNRQQQALAEREEPQVGLKLRLDRPRRRISPNPAPSPPLSPPPTLSHNFLHLTTPPH